jgi:hypothetical protein
VTTADSFVALKTNAGFELRCARPFHYFADCGNTPVSLLKRPSAMFRSDFSSGPTVHSMAYPARTFSRPPKWLRTRSAPQHPHRESRRRRAVLHPELGVYLFQVLVHSTRTEAQDFGDVAVGFAPRDPHQDL